MRFARGSRFGFFADRHIGTSSSASLKNYRSRRIWIVYLCHPDPMGSGGWARERVCSCCLLCGNRFGAVQQGLGGNRVGAVQQGRGGLRQRWFQSMRFPRRPGMFLFALVLEVDRQH